jgi:hypothetical protein
LFEKVHSQQDAACSATDDDDVHIRNSLGNIVFQYMIAGKGESRVFDFCSIYYKFLNSVDKINVTKMSYIYYMREYCFKICSVFFHDCVP